MRRKYASPNRKFNNTVLKIGNFDCKGTVLVCGRMGCFIYLASGNQKNRPFGYIYLASGNQKNRPFGYIDLLALVLGKFAVNCRAVEVVASDVAFE